MLCCSFCTSDKYYGCAGAAVALKENPRQPHTETLVGESGKRFASVGACSCNQVASVRLSFTPRPTRTHFVNTHLEAMAVFRLSRVCSRADPLSHARPFGSIHPQPPSAMPRGDAEGSADQWYPAYQDCQVCHEQGHGITTCAHSRQQERQLSITGGLAAEICCDSTHVPLFILPQCSQPPLQLCMHMRTWQRH